MITYLFPKIALMSIVAGIAGCKTTSPITKSQNSQSEPSEQSSAAAADAPLLVSSTSEGAPDSDSGFKPIALEWVVVKSSVTEGVDDAFTWQIYLRSAVEIFCELDCSDFKLGEKTVNGVTELTALKKTTHGNSNPGILNVRKEIRWSKDLVKTIKINNIGIMGQSIILKENFTKTNPNFYAVPMLISKPVDSSMGILRGEFSGKKVEIRLEAGVETPKLGLEPESAFVLGNLTSNNSSDPGNYEEFHASKILLPWNGN
jgi:hypothetical protein